LKVFSTAPKVEEVITSGINQTEYGSYLALEPRQAQRVIDAIKGALEKAAVTMEQPVILCPSTIRRHLKKLCERFELQVAVISHNEIPSGLQVQSVREISLGA
jgi:flagellar biosynthesis protein FlhA